MMDTIQRSRFKNFFRGHWTNKVVAVLVALIVAVSGYWLVSGHAAGFFAAVEADSGTLSGNAALVSDANASGGKAVQFNAPSTPPGGGGGGGGGGTTPPPPSTRPDPFPASMKPDASNTGLLDPTVLTVVNGDQVFGTSYNGQTVSNKDFHGYVKVTGSNITFKNCIFRGGTPSGNNALLDLQNDGNPGTGNVVEDSEFVPTKPNATIDGIWAQNATIVRVNVHGSTDAIKASSNTTIRDSYLHDLQWYNYDPNTSDGTHNDTVQILDGTNIRVVHNNMNPNNSNANSSVQITQDFGPTGIVSLDSNWADWGGCSFGISQKHNSDMSGTLTGVSVTNNRFGRHMEYTGCAILIGTRVTLAANTGNVWDDTGQPVPAPQQHD